MENKYEIVISHFNQEKSQREIAREMQISRNTVKKYLEQYQKEKSQKGEIAAPKYDAAHRKKRHLSPEIILLITGFLKQNKLKKQKGILKQNMNGTDIHEAILAKGHKIGYTTVCNYIRHLNQKSQEVFIHQSYERGQTAEFDWGHVKLELDGKLKSLMLAVFTSANSNYRWARLYFREDMLSFLDSHVHYFNHTGGTPKEIVYDNMRVAVMKYARKNADKKPTDALLKLLTYYQIAHRFCNARKGNEKGHVEKSVGFIRRKAFALTDCFDSLEKANEHLLCICNKLNNRNVKDKQASIYSEFQEELKCMKPLPVCAYDTATITAVKVDKLALVKVDTNYYSVMEGHVGQMVEAKSYADSVKMYNQKNELIAQHRRHHTRFEYYIDLNHYLKTLYRKPGALKGSTALKQADEALKKVYQFYFSKQSRAFIELLIWLKTNQITTKEFTDKVRDYASKFPNKHISCDEIKVLLSLKNKDKNEADHSPKSEMSASIKAHSISLLNQIQARTEGNNSIKKSNTK